MADAVKCMPADTGEAKVTGTCIQHGVVTMLTTDAYQTGRPLHEKGEQTHTRTHALTQCGTGGH